MQDDVLYGPQASTKLSWNQFNQFPHDTFTWRGIDGSEVLAHFVTTPEKDDGSWHYTYNGLMTPFDVKGLWDNYRQKGINDEVLMLYGWATAVVARPKKCWNRRRCCVICRAFRAWSLA